MIAWSSSGSSGTDSYYGTSIQARRFSTNGDPLNSDFQVNTYTSGNQFRPGVAIHSNGDFLVVWDSEGSLGIDVSGQSIQGQRFSADGNPLGDQFQINSYTTGDQGFPAIAAAPDDQFAVAWISYGSSGSDTDSLSIQARSFSTNGEPLNDQVQVNSYTSSFQNTPAIAAGPDGFIVTWRSYGSSGSDSSGLSTQARRLSTGGDALGDQFQVNSSPPPLRVVQLST